MRSLLAYLSLLTISVSNTDSEWCFSIVKKICTNQRPISLKTMKFSKSTVLLLSQFSLRNSSQEYKKASSKVIKKRATLSQSVLLTFDDDVIFISITS